MKLEIQTYTKEAQRFYKSVPKSRTRGRALFEKEKRRSKTQIPSQAVIKIKITMRQIASSQR
jgi:hypothetical protein